MHFRQFLTSLPAFQGLPDREVDVLIESLREERHVDGHAFSMQGVEGAAMYVLLDGTVRVTRCDDAGNVVDGQELRGGEIFGLLGLVDRLPSTSTAVATGPVAVVGVDRDAYARLFEGAPHVAHRLQYMVAVQLARELQYRNRLLRMRMRKGAAP